MLRLNTKRVPQTFTDRMAGHGSTVQSHPSEGMHGVVIGSLSSDAWEMYVKWTAPQKSRTRLSRQRRARICLERICTKCLSKPAVS